MKIVIIGGGASGLIASIKAKNNDNEVIILEANSDIGKKILITGNGHCNYWHEGINSSKYHTDNVENLNIILNKKDDTLSFLENIGLVPIIKDGYFYPLSKEAKSVRDTFKYQILKKGIKVITDYQVTSIKKENNTFIISNGIEPITCDKVIISCGTKASIKDYSSNILDNLSSFSHTINPLLPGLVPIEIEDAKKYNWAGIRTHALLTLVSDAKTIKEEEGELQLTNDGLSGICTFNLSSIISRMLNNHEEPHIYINFLPHIENIKEYLDKRAAMLNNPTINELFNSLLSYKLIGVIANSIRIKTDTHYNELSEKEKKWLINSITNFECIVSDTGNFDRAQVCTGGIPLSEINPETMESTKISGLYITGEILDVDGECGGYNLAFAFTSGYIAGMSVNHD